MARKILNTILFFILLFLGSSTMLAQINPPTCTFPGGCCPDGFPPQFCPNCPPCVPVPFNGELWLLLIAGLILGYYFLKKKELVPSS